MAQGATGSATVLLEQWRAGDESARERLLTLLQGEMRGIARRLMRKERRGHTLQPTAVVNEACLRLLGSSDPPSRSRGDFLGLVARVMRQVLVDHSRRRDADKRGGDWQRVSLQADRAVADPGEALVDALDLDAALTKLADLSPRQAQVVELRYFAGLSIPEAAEVLGLSAATVKGEWGVARAWLRRELGSSGSERTSSGSERNSSGSEREPPGSEP